VNLGNIAKKSMVLLYWHARVGGDCERADKVIGKKKQGHAEAVREGPRT